MNIELTPVGKISVKSCFLLSMLACNFLREGYCHRHFIWKWFRIILISIISLPAFAIAKSGDTPLTWDVAYVTIYDWWGKTSDEKISVKEIKPILLSNNESAFLAGVYFFNRGRNFMDGAILIRPARKEVKDMSEYIDPGFEIKDLDHDGVSEIVTQTMGSGQGSTIGSKRILQFDGWTPVILLEADFEDHSGVCGHRDDCNYKSTEWKFLELKDKTNLLEFVHSFPDSLHAATKINLYTYQNRKFTKVESTEMKWDTPMIPNKGKFAGRKEGEKQLPKEFEGHRGDNRYFEELAQAYRESTYKPALPSEAEELSKKANIAIQDKNFSLNYAISLYSDALRYAPWWPTGYYDRAIINAELEQFGSAIQDMERYLMLDPTVQDAGPSRDKIAIWKRTLLHQELEDMVVIPSGVFMMGSLSCTDGDRYSKSVKLECDNELPQHHVSIKRFEMGRYPVTFGQWNACVADGGCSGYRQDGNRPVNPVNWQDVQSYIAWLNKKTGKRYRLPTEAEWEYAARAGSTTNYYWGDDADSSYANINESFVPSGGDENVTPVGTFAPNGFGMYDMAGNVWQLVEDCYHENYVNAPIDGSAWTVGDCSVGVKRGGEWSSPARYARSTARGSYRRADYEFGLGFRIARSLE